MGRVDRTPGVPGDINISEGVDCRGGCSIESCASELHCGITCAWISAWNVVSSSCSGYQEIRGGSIATTIATSGVETQKKDYCRPVPISSFEIGLQGRSSCVICCGMAGCLEPNPVNVWIQTLAISIPSWKLPNKSEKSNGKFLRKDNSTGLCGICLLTTGKQCVPAKHRSRKAKGMGWEGHFHTVRGFDRSFP